MKKIVSGLVVLCVSVVCLIAQQPPQTKVNPKDHQTYVWIPAGSFSMGCSPNDHQCAPDEVPVHKVEITKGFWMGQTPVTVAAWKAYRAAANKPALLAADEFGRKLNEAASDDQQPVVEVTWGEAKDYCSVAGMRLPSEAEWEYAARAGSKESTYAWLDTVAWYGDNSGRKGIDSVDMNHADPSRYQRKLFNNGNGPRPVKKKDPNAWGLYDMLGNVWEWVDDYYADNYYTMSGAQDPHGPASGTQRVLRGGAWNSLPANVRVSYRMTNPPADRVNTFGVRCAGDLP